MSKFQAVKMTPKMVSCIKSVAEIQKEYGIPDSVLRTLIERTKEEEARQKADYHRELWKAAYMGPWPAGFSVRELELLKAPTQTVSSITYHDASGEIVVLTPSQPDCPDCHGTGEYRGLNAVEPCRTCRKAVD